MVVAPLKDQTVDEVTEAFVSKLILVYGIPQDIVTVQGTNFVSNLFKRICDLFKIEKLNTAAYRPQSIGALERTHKTLITYLRCFCNRKTTD